MSLTNSFRAKALWRFYYCIYPKYSDTSTPYHICSKIWTSTIHYPMLCLKIAGWVANSVDPDETPRSAASHLGLNCLLRPVCPNTYGKYGIELRTMKSMPGLPKLVQHLTDYVEVFGIEVESDLPQSWKSTDPWCCQRYYTHAKLGQFTNGMPKDQTTSIQAVLENFKRSSGKTGFQTQKSWKGRGCRVYILF